MLSNNPVRVWLLEGKHKLVYVFSAFVPVPFVAANIRTHAKLVQVVTTQSTIYPYGIYAVRATIHIGGLSHTPTKTEYLEWYVTKTHIRRLLEIICKS
jgi:hypothetical protein